MLDLGIGFGQGIVFSPPRPVRPEVFAEPQPEAAPAPKPAAAMAPPVSAEVVEHPAMASPPEVKRVPFRDILRRATA